MDLVISLLVLSTVTQLGQLVVPPLSFRTAVEITSGDSRVFSGDSVRLRCTIPDTYNFTWHYLWFRGSEELPQSRQDIVLWNTNIRDSGNYSCRGFRKSIVGKLHTLQSLPVEIIVDGGWAILQVPPHPGLVGQPLMMTCLVRANPPIREVILYKDGVEVLRQQGQGGRLYLTNLTLEDGGLYSCRASWNKLRHTLSVISTATLLQVLEVLTQPIIEIVDTNSPTNPSNIIKLVCHVQYNARDPAPPIHFYFYKKTKHLGTAASHNYILVTRSPGTFSCMATVPQFEVSRWSDPKTFGQVTGAQPSFLPDSGPWISASRDMTLYPSFEPSEVKSYPHPPTAPTVDSAQSFQSPLMTSQPAPTTSLPVFQSVNNKTVASEAEDAFGEMSGDSPDAE